MKTFFTHLHIVILFGLTKTIFLKLCVHVYTKTHIMTHSGSGIKRKK